MAAHEIIVGLIILRMNTYKYALLRSDCQQETPLNQYGMWATCDVSKRFILHCTALPAFVHAHKNKNNSKDDDDIIT